MFYEFSMKRLRFSYEIPEFNKYQTIGMFIRFLGHLILQSLDNIYLRH